MIFGPENRRLYINFDRDRRFKTTSRGRNGKPLAVDERLIELTICRGVNNTYFYFSFIWFFVCFAVHHEEANIEEFEQREKGRIDLIGRKMALLTMETQKRMKRAVGAEVIHLSRFRKARRP